MLATSRRLDVPLRRSLAPAGHHTQVGLGRSTDTIGQVAPTTTALSSELYEPRWVRESTDAAQLCSAGALRSPNPCRSPRQHPCHPPHPLVGPAHCRRITSNTTAPSPSRLYPLTPPSASSTLPPRHHGQLPFPQPDLVSPPRLPRLSWQLQEHQWKRARRVPQKQQAPHRPRRAAVGSHAPNRTQRLVCRTLVEEEAAAVAREGQQA